MIDSALSQAPVFFTDFDGTITNRDTLVALLDHYADPKRCGCDWRDIEFDPTRPEVDKLQAELDLLNCSLPEALAFIDKEIRLRSGFLSCARRLAEQKIPLIVLSGGLLPLIHHVLDPLELDNLQIFANDLRIDNGRWLATRPDLPRSGKSCNHCKSWHLRQLTGQSRLRIYAGDGSTDFCAAGLADVVFARDTLATHFHRTERRYQRFRDWHDVTQYLVSHEILASD